MPRKGCQGSPWGVGLASESLQLFVGESKALSPAVSPPWHPFNVFLSMLGMMLRIRIMKTHELHILLQQSEEHLTCSE